MARLLRDATFALCVPRRRRPPNIFTETVIALFLLRDDNIESVEDYLKGAGEATFITMLVTWTLTFVYNRDKIRHNPLKNVMGYNNPCVGWDFPPANSVGLFGMVLVTVLVWRHNVLDAHRTAVKAAGRPLAFHQKFSLVANLCHACSVTALCLVFIAGPTDGAWGWHTVLFVQHIFFRYLCCLGNFLEVYGGYARARADAPRGSIAYLWVFGLVSLSLPVMYLINFATYDGPPPPLRCEAIAPNVAPKPLRDPAVPWFLTMAFDYTWFLCLALGTHFMPQDVPLRVRVAVKWGGEASWAGASEAAVEAAALAHDRRARQKADCYFN